MEKAAEKFPDSLGEYKLLKDEYHNGHPVFQNSAKDKRYIIYIGKKKYLYLTKHCILVFHQEIIGTSHKISTIMQRKS